MATKKKSVTNSTSFKKGQSGNPGGRSPRVGPNGETLAVMARAHTLLALNALVGVCNNKFTEDKDRISASVAILDRGWGRPTESVNLDAKVEGAGLPIIQIVRYEGTGEGN